MKRLLVGLLAFALLATACKSSGPAAAVVNGHRISAQEVVDELNAINGNADYLSLVESNLSQAGGKVKGTRPGSFDAGFVAQVLRLQIGNELIHQEFQRRGLVVDDACRAAARNDIYSNAGAANADKGRQVYEAFPASYQATLLQRDAETLALQADLVRQPCQSDDPARAYYEAHQADFAQTCFSVIVVDAGSGDGIVQQLQGGADFATLAKADSQDQTAAQGGDLGCRSAAETPPVIADAVTSTPVGQVAPPVVQQNVAIIVKVTDRKPSPPFDQVREQAAELAAQDAGKAFNAWLQGAVKSATVTVDQRYGVWNADSFSIDQPPAATDASSSPSGG